MINFRYHLASLVAVFLALAIGVVMGTTVIQEAIVDGLHTQINDARSRANSTQKANGELSGQVKHLQDVVTDLTPYSVDDALAGASVTVIAQRGVDSRAVDATAALLRESGATVPGVLWLDDSWALGTKYTGAVTKLEAVLGAAAGSGIPSGVGSGSSTTSGGSHTSDHALRGAAYGALAQRLSVGPGPGGDILGDLVKAGFVDIDAAGAKGLTSASAFGGPETRILLVGGPASTVAVDGMLADMTRALVAGSSETVVGEVYRAAGDGPARGAALDEIRRDASLTAVVSTVDDLDADVGRISTVIALADLPRDIVGQYGEGEGASALVPTRQP